jgi:hypothetical protein
MVLVAAVLRYFGLSIAASLRGNPMARTWARCIAVRPVMCLTCSRQLKPFVRITASAGCLRISGNAISNPSSAESRSYANARASRAG